MKHLSKIVVALLFVFAYNSANAQDERNAWGVTLGTNAVDLYPVGEDDAGLGTYFDEYFNVEDHWNIIPTLSYIQVKRYVGDNISVAAAGSVNKIKKVGDFSVDDLSYYALDGTISYDLTSLVSGNWTWFRPYVGVGGGYTWVDTIGFGTANGTAGVNIQLNDVFALTVQSSYKHAFEDYGSKHFQHSAGVTFSFGGTDTDGDGIYDDEDACPEVPGLEAFNGCPDTDSDGIQDSEDKCPLIPGTAAFNGCVDTDGDGIADPNDQCPTEAGPAYNNGCPDPDTDGDGVLDSKDQCVNEVGPASNNGCPIPVTDRDGDGVNDNDDQCPDVAGPASNNGCPVVTAEVQKTLNDYAKTILFDSGKSSIKAQSQAVLNDITAILKEYPTARFTVDGHTDSQGREASNQALSDSRAAAVKSFLVGKGIPSARLMSKGYGESNPIASNKTRAGRAQNRRVEINLIKN